MPATHIAILNYPDSLQSAVFGLTEMFALANRAQGTELFQVDILKEDLPEITYSVVIIPPNINSAFTDNPPVPLTDWIKSQKSKGAVLCAACAGCFILAQCGLLDNREATTHWALSKRFERSFPKAKLDSDKILINEGDLITAGGLMAWIDLGLELIAQYASPSLMREVGKTLVIDTGPREQRFYKSFRPVRDHGDLVILKLQDHLQSHYQDNMSLAQMAKFCTLGDRTFLRRFKAACQMTPVQYLQKLRIQKACNFLENTRKSVEEISYQVGYDDITAFRRTFIKITGLTPREFRNRFGP